MASTTTHNGMGAENRGALGMIEMIHSNFARLESETTAAETEGQQEYDQFVADSEIDTTTKKSYIEHQTGMKSKEETRQRVL